MPVKESGTLFPKSLKDMEDARPNSTQASTINTLRPTPSSNTKVWPIPSRQGFGRQMNPSLGYLDWINLLGAKMYKAWSTAMPHGNWLPPLMKLVRVPSLSPPGTTGPALLDMESIWIVSMRSTNIIQYSPCINLVMHSHWVCKSVSIDYYPSNSISTFLVSLSQSFGAVLLSSVAPKFLTMLV